jgi:hypothetical protein
MRKITKQACQAFLLDKKFTRDNTMVRVEQDRSVGRVVYMYLFGNAIARKLIGAPTFEICDGGWQSNTTKERLNGLPGVTINHNKRRFYLNGVKWDGNWIMI